MRRDVVDPLLIEENVAALNAVEARNHAQERRLAAARRTEQGEELSVFDVLRDSRNDREIAVLFDCVLNMNRYTHTVSSKFNLFRIASNPFILHSSDYL